MGMKWKNEMKEKETIWPEFSFSLLNINKMFASNFHNKRVNDGCLRSVMELDVYV